MSEEKKVLSLEDIRARVQARPKDSAPDVSQLPTFHHDGLGGDVHYGALSSADISRFQNIEQYYPLNYQDAELRGMKASTDEQDMTNRVRLLLSRGVYTSDGKRLPSDTIEWLLNDAASGPANSQLAVLIKDRTFSEENEAAVSGDKSAAVECFTRYQAAFFDLLHETGWTAHFVEYLTAQDTTTPEAKEAAEKLLKLEALAPEWARKLEAHELYRNLYEKKVVTE